MAAIQLTYKHLGVTIELSQDVAVAECYLDAFSHTTRPVITLLGGTTVSFEAGYTTYADAGATAVDETDGDMTASIVTVNPVDSTLAGSYLVTYNVADLKGHPARPIARTVIVTPDVTPPAITLVGDEGLLLWNYPYEAYVELGATATDILDGSVDVIPTGPVDTSTAGSYTVTYTATDAAGNDGIETRTVVVQHRYWRGPLGLPTLTKNALGITGDDSPGKEGMALSGDGNTIALAAPWEGDGKVIVHKYEAGGVTQHGDKFYANNTVYQTAVTDSYDTNLDDYSVSYGGVDWSWQDYDVFALGSSKNMHAWDRYVDFWYDSSDPTNDFAYAGDGVHGWAEDEINFFYSYGNFGIAAAMLADGNYGEESGTENRLGYAMSMDDAGRRAVFADFRVGEYEGVIQIYGESTSGWAVLAHSIRGVGFASTGYDVQMSGDGYSIVFSGGPGHNVQVYIDSQISAGFPTQAELAAGTANVWTAKGTPVSGGPDGTNAVDINYDGSVFVTSITAPDSYEAFPSGGGVKVYEYGSDWEQIGTIAPQGQSSSIWGWSVAVNGAGDVVAVGDPNHFGATADRWTGGVQVFEKLDGVDSWAQRGSTITNSTTDALGAYVDLDSSGNRLIVAATNGDGAVGKYYVYEWDGAEWLQIASFDAAATYELGWADQIAPCAISASGQTVIVSDLVETVYPAQNAGISVHKITGAGWQRLPDVVPQSGTWDSGNRAFARENGPWNNTNTFAESTISLSIDGTVLCVTCWDEATRIYRLDGGVWTETGVLDPFNGASYADHYPRKSALSRDGLSVIVANALVDEFGTNAGAIAVYEWGGSSWVQKGANFTVGAKQQNGARVAISGDGTVVGVSNVLTGSGPDYVVIAQWDGSAWVMLGDALEIDGGFDYPYNDSSGFTCALSYDGLTAAIGYPIINAVGGSYTTHSGQVEVYNFDGAQWVQMGNPIEGGFSPGGEGLGITSDISNDGLTVVIGSSNYDGPQNSSDPKAKGRVQVFKFNGTDWVRLGPNEFYAGEVGDYMGAQVAISANASRIAYNVPGLDTETPDPDKTLIHIKDFHDLL